MEEHHDVIIIGAGISGISAALRLQSYGYDVVVLEARPRVGGRIHTDRSMNGTPLDVGASWISGIKENPIHKLAQKYEAKFARVSEGAGISTYDYNGTPLGSYFQGEMKIAWDDFLNFMQNEQNQIGITKSLAVIVKKYMQDKNLDLQNQREFEYAISMIENDWAGSIENLSAKFWDHIGYLLPGGQDVFRDGYDIIIRGLVNELGEDKIHLLNVVKTIHYNDDGVKIITDKQDQFYGKYAVCTLPLGVLQKNHTELFSPNLPSEKITALNHLGTGVFHKTYLKFEKCFWDVDKDKVWINYVSEKKGFWNQFVNMYQVTGGQPILLGLNAADYATQLYNKTQDEIVEEAMVALRAIYKDKTLEPIESIVTHWIKDEYAHGAYSYTGPGATLDDYDKIAQPVKNDEKYRVFFAGEATTKYYPATVHGAYVTGLREANRIYAFDKKLREPVEQQLDDEKEWLVFPEQVICPVGKELIVQKKKDGEKIRFIPYCVTPEEKSEKLKNKDEWLDTLASTPWDYF